MTERRFVGFVGVNPNGDFKMLACSAEGDTSSEAWNWVRTSSQDWVSDHPLEPWEELAIYELVEVVAINIPELKVEPAPHRNLLFKTARAIWHFTGSVWRDWFQPAAPLLIAIAVVAIAYLVWPA